MHPHTSQHTKGACVFILKCLFLGTSWDTGDFTLDTQFDHDLEDTIRAFQNAHGLTADGCFGQDTRKKFFEVLGINVDSIPFSMLTNIDLALQPTGEIVQWPPSSLIILGSNNTLPDGSYRLLPPYIDHPSVHTSGSIGQSMGVSIFIVKCLFAGTEFVKMPFFLDITFCMALHTCLTFFQKKQNIEIDGCFGQETRRAFHKHFSRDIEMIPRNVLHEQSRALQPDGRIIAWPPEITLSRI